MKKNLYILASFLCLFFVLSNQAFAQEENTESEFEVLYLIEKQNGFKFIGRLIEENAREVLLETEELGEVYIPRHTIRRMHPILQDSQESLIISDELFATRYFITTNGLPIHKGESYIQWNWYGPDFQFGVADNFGVGVMSSWAAIPVIGTAKYTINLGENKNLALGLLAGTGSWALPEYGLILPYVSFTIGDRKNNLTLSTGYGGLFIQEEDWNQQTQEYDKINRSEGRLLFSLAGMAKVNEKFSIVFDTFISPWGKEHEYTEYQNNGYWDEETQMYIDKYEEYTYKERSPNLALILPGIRWQMDADRAFQFGFTGLYFDGEFVPAPIPMVQWYRRL